MLTLAALLVLPLTPGCFGPDEGRESTISIHAWDGGTNSTTADGLIVLNETETQSEVPQLAKALEEASAQGSATIPYDSNTRIFTYLNGEGEEQGVGPGPEWLVEWRDGEFLISVVT